MSTVNPISSIIPNLISSTAQAAPKTDESKFASVLANALENSEQGGISNVVSDAFDTVKATDDADKLSTLQLLAGDADSLSGLLIDAQKAELSLNLALQLRNKVLDAYKEIMSMQV